MLMISDWSCRTKGCLQKHTLSETAHFLTKRQLQESHNWAPATLMSSFTRSMKVWGTKPLKATFSVNKARHPHCGWAKQLDEHKVTLRAYKSSLVRFLQEALNWNTGHSFCMAFSSTFWDQLSNLTTYQKHGMNVHYFIKGYMKDNTEATKKP